MTVRALIPAAAIAVVAVLMILLQGAWNARDAAKRAAVAAQARAAVAETQGDLGEGAAKAVQAAQARELTLTIRAKEAAHDIAQTAGGDAGIPPDVLARWAGAIDGLRVEAAAQSRRSDGPRGGSSADAVPTPAAANGAERG
jgi:hypothetical protein